MEQHLKKNFLNFAISDPSKNIIHANNQEELNHENNHLEFSKSKLGMNIQYLGEISQFYTTIGLVITFFFEPFKYFCLIGIILMLFSFIFEEVYCNQ